MKILFLDQTAKIAGAELVLLDVAKPYRDNCLVCLFETGPFEKLLEQNQISVSTVASQSIKIRRESTFIQSLTSLPQFISLIGQVVQLSKQYDLIYANTLKALIVGAIVSSLSRRSLVFHLHDILSSQHFSNANRQVVVTLANQFASRVIAVSQATQKAFIESGGRTDLIEIVYNGFEPERYQGYESSSTQVRAQLGLSDRFLVGHFSRLSSWKGQHVLLEALAYCPQDVTAIFVGDALFGEQEYVKSLHQQVVRLGLSDRVQFLGFRSDIPALMSTCNLIAHTSTAAEPFGRVIVEGMLCDRPVVAAAEGGALELVEHGVTGWLCPPDDPQKLAEIIRTCRDDPDQAKTIAHQGKQQASDRFNLTTTNEAIDKILSKICT